MSCPRRSLRLFATAFTSHGDDGFSFDVHSAAHGHCTVQFTAERNAVRELKVFAPDGHLLVAMKRRPAVRPAWESNP